MILVIDGQGGGVGKAIIEALRAAWPEAEIVAVGANAIATGAMLKAGASTAATGENAVVYQCRRADIILGALGIGFANAMHGEISPRMAAAVSESDALKALIPVSKCNVRVLGLADRPLAAMIAELVELVGERLGAG